MAGMGLAASYGAGGAAKGLSDVLEQRFVAQRLAEQERAQREQEALQRAEQAQALENTRFNQGLGLAQLQSLDQSRREAAAARAEDIARKRDEDEIENQRKVFEQEQAYKREGRKQEFESTEGEKRDAAAALRARIAAGASGDRKQPFQWVTRNGEQVYTNEVQQGDKPSRDLGRKVLAHDAEELSIMATSLDELDALEQTLPKGSTGVMAQIGAAVPSAVTSATGFGVSAKKKQATIELVKQIIGKGLEEGVLRKEDEAKYAKILPTVADPDDVVAAKIKGLRADIRKKYARRLEALTSAGYETGAFPEDPQRRVQDKSTDKPKTRIRLDAQGNEIP